MSVMGVATLRAAHCGGTVSKPERSNSRSPGANNKIEPAQRDKAWKIGVAKTCPCPVGFTSQTRGATGSRENQRVLVRYASQILALGGVRHRAEACKATLHENPCHSSNMIYWPSVFSDRGRGICSCTLAEAPLTAIGQGRRLRRGSSLPSGCSDRKRRGGRCRALEASVCGCVRLRGPDYQVTETPPWRLCSTHHPHRPRRWLTRREQHADSVDLRHGSAPQATQCRATFRNSKARESGRCKATIRPWKNKQTSRRFCAGTPASEAETFVGSPQPRGPMRYPP